MNELIKISENELGSITDARELHAFLESKKDFSSWIKGKISKYGFVENQDYTLLTQKGEQTRGGHNAIDYALTLDTAKELCMLEGNAKGKEARKFFIAAEKKLRENTKPISIEEMIIAQAQSVIESKKRIEVVEQKVKELEAKQITSPMDFYTVAGYGTIAGIKVDRILGANLGKKASAICKDLGYTTGIVPDPRFGTVKTYHKEVLENIFAAYQKNL